MFSDVAKIYIRSGKGGDGKVSFRREMFVAAGGPDGGDGGRGGDVIFEIDTGLNTLADYRFIRKYSAGDGENGGGKRCSGKDGLDVILKVPEGTVIKDEATGKVIADMSHENRRMTILRGGRGGKGNQHYATATMQVPKYAQPGQECQELNVILELKVIADVGLVGYPNVGKSTLLSSVTNARPKIANYHFTTLNPNLGVVDLPNGEGFVIADIPGLIEGASDGVGLGHEFLKHIERTKVLIHIVDAASVEGRDPIDDIRKINYELKNYQTDLSGKPQIIAANKTDAMLPEEAEAVITDIKKAFSKENYPVYAISAVSGKGVKELMFAVNDLLKTIPDEPTVYEREFFPEDLRTLDEPFTVTYDEEEDEYVVEGPRIERMLGYTNIDSEKGFEFFQKFLKENDILRQLEELGIKDGDTVRMYGNSFDYYKS